MPCYLELIPLLKRIQNRIPEEEILKFVSDEDNAIIGSVKSVFPNVPHSFCVFHQLKNVTRKYLDEFRKIENIPHYDRQIYDLATDLILSESVIHLSIHYKNIVEMASAEIMSKASKNVIAYIKDIYSKNKELLEAGALRLDYSERAEGRWESEGTNWGWNHFNINRRVRRETQRKEASYPLFI